MIPSDQPPRAVAPADRDGDPRKQTARKASRRRILKSGVIAFNGRFSTIPCVVRDLSSDGAHVRVEGSAHVPNAFELIIEIDGLEAQCEVAWRKDREIGVKFTSPPRVRPPRRAQSVTPLAPHQPHSLRRKPLS